MSNRVYTPRGKITNRLSSVSSYHPTYSRFIRSQVLEIRVDGFHPFDTKASDFFPHYLVLDRKSRECSIDRRTDISVSALEVFKDPRILPYRSVLSPSSYKKEVELLANSVYSPIQPGTRRVYRLTDTWIIDDYGRFYSLNPDTSRYEWYQYPLSGDARNRFTLRNNDGTYLKNTPYFFNAVSGYRPLVQDYFASSGYFDFHHILENKMDLRPSSVVPLEIGLHRKIHEEYSKTAGFFRKSRVFSLM